jgi:hypothetical protein
MIASLEYRQGIRPIFSDVRRYVGRFDELYHRVSALGVRGNAVKAYPKEDELETILHISLPNRLRVKRQIARITNRKAAKRILAEIEKAKNAALDWRKTGIRK